MDGTLICEDFPISPDINVENVLEMCISFLDMDLKYSKDFGIFVEILNDDAHTPRVSRSLRNQEYIGELLDQDEYLKVYSLMWVHTF